VQTNTPNTQPVVDPAIALARAEKAKRQNKAAKAKTPTPARTHNKNGVRLALGLTCLCGCGAPTHTTHARFVSGHDAKLRRGIKAAGFEWTACPEIIRPFYEDGEVIAGLALAEDEQGERRFVDRHAGGIWS
jgi:hypothetical protein